MIFKNNGIIISNEPIIEDFVYLMKINEKNIADIAKPGQFLEIKTGSVPLLRKPISIFEVDKVAETISILYQVKGPGTKNLSELKANQQLDIIGPLGTGFTVKKFDNKCLLIGGGIGIAPLYDLGLKLKESGNEIEIVLGFSSKDTSYALDYFSKLGTLTVATMDGSLGIKGTVEAILSNYELNTFDKAYACGPEPMLKYLKTLEDKVNLELSLEAYMGCGLGACLSCVCKMTDGTYKRVCKEGPVFKSKEVSFDE
ncbi:MAG: dihydroorotate dehydrogenase electron transfer subunit [Firmicutes bacterium]|nr:dihydroorotate dehydrogenase electron transfer subunit [Bacillota bacterium]